MFKRAAMPYLTFYLPMFEGEGVVAPGGGGGDAGGTWYAKAGVAPEHHEWLGAKEFADPSVAIASHRALEGLVGRNRLAIPNGPEDAEAYNAIYRQLGRPDKADAYKLPDDVSKVFKPDEWKQFAPIFHEAGASQAMVDKITTAYAKRAGDIAAAQEAERAAVETREVAALEAEWASNGAANKDIAARAFRALGLDADATSKIESALGYANTMKLFHNIGKGMSESAFHQDDVKRNAGGVTGEQLQTKISNLLKDPEFKARYNDRDPRKRASAIDEMEALQKQLADINAKKAPA